MKKKKYRYRIWEEDEDIGRVKKIENCLIVINAILLLLIAINWLREQLFN